MPSGGCASVCLCGLLLSGFWDDYLLNFRQFTLNAVGSVRGDGIGCTYQRKYSIQRLLSQWNVFRRVDCVVGWDVSGYAGWAYPGGGCDVFGFCAASRCAGEGCVLSIYRFAVLCFAECIRPGNRYVCPAC